MKVTMRKRTIFICGVLILGTCAGVLTVGWPLFTVTLGLGNADPEHWAVILRGDSSKLKRIVALERLKGLYPQAPDKVLASLGDALRSDPDAQIRLQVAIFLRSIGHDARPAIGVLIEALRDNDEDVRVEVMSALSSFGPEAKDAIPSLLDAVEHAQTGREREEAARALRMIDPNGGGR
ncbi:hypothetical protein AYO40_00595 [Planctomycetaceae bacterium SCGC AG-212-D15]|nr:hypothetical protein AYO40_00595 [Planctomycetaceae bacterium SCGC AG-212-D15]